MSENNTFCLINDFTLKRLYRPIYAISNMRKTQVPKAQNSGTIFMTKRRHYNLVFLHARRKTFPAFADIAEALASVWPWGQYRLNTKDVNKRRVFENEVVMLGTF